ncbi:o-succinylbenzoate synthase [Kytococcus sedentarius]|uniref:o-succinylbenzoate synthase n=1 Tax=Kytococcus sedentarius TaxID=1276 RepID=UPI0035BBBAF7
MLPCPTDRPRAVNDPTLGRELPGLEELLAHLVVVRLPMVVRFRGLTTRETALVKGPLGWAEFAPFTEYDDAESARWLASTLEAGWWGWPAPIRPSVPVNVTVPAVAAEEVPSVVARVPGAQTAKIKVAERTLLERDEAASTAADLARIAAVRAAMGPDAAVRIDANGAWSVRQAARALEGVAATGERLDYCEQPCASAAELAELRELLAARGVPTRIAADESIRRAADPLLVRALDAADLIVVKAATLGGAAAAAQIVTATGLPAVVSSALESSVGLCSGVALASSMPELAGACGLGTAALFSQDVTSAPLLPEGGRLGLRRVEPDRAEQQAAPDRRDWWAHRIERGLELLRAGQAG